MKIALKTLALVISKTCHPILNNKPNFSHKKTEQISEDFQLDPKKSQKSNN